MSSKSSRSITPVKLPSNRTTLGKLHDKMSSSRRILLPNYTETSLKFTNESFIHQAFKDAKGISHYMKEEDERRPDIDSTPVTKEVEHKKASTETQLVHLSAGRTMEGKVDLKKIVDIRRSIRRRYANRTDFRKIFNAWDRESLGVLRTEDVHDMVNKIGVQVNLDEARVLLATANKSMTGVLSLPEFLELIFDDSDKINVDLSAISDTSVHHTPDKFMKSLQELTLNQHTQKMQASLMRHIKDHLYDISSSLIKVDKRKTGLVSFEAFCDVLNNMNLTHTFSNEKYWRLLYTEMGGGDEGIKYTSFVQKMREFKPTEDSEPEQTVHTDVQREYNKRAERIEAAKELRPLLLDKKLLPVSRLEQMMKTLVPLKAKLVKLYFNEKQLKSALQAYAEDDKISANELQRFIKSVCPGLFIKETGHFLSAFNYNQEGYTEVAEVVKQVFSAEEKGMEELESVRRVLPPKSRVGERLARVNVKRYLKNIDQRMLWGNKSYEAFKRMDRDCDGYISSQDMCNSLQRMNLDVTETDVTAVMDEIDADNKGYLTFQKFAKQMSTPILQKSRGIWDKSESSMQPSATFQQSLNSYRDSSSYYSTLIDSLRPSKEPVSYTVCLSKPIT